MVHIDDFKLMLGLEYLWDTTIKMLPYFDLLMMMDSKPYVIPRKAGRVGEKSISTMQFRKGFKRNKPSFRCTLGLEEIEEVIGPILKPMKMSRKFKTSCLMNCKGDCCQEEQSIMRLSSF